MTLLLFASAQPISGCKDDKTQTTSKAAAEVVEALSNAEAELPKAPVSVGDTVYDFSALAHTGQRIQLSDFAERPTIVYFCTPVDSAPCVALAQGIRDSWLALRAQLSMVLGVTGRDTIVNRDLASEQELSHLLLSDPEGHVREVFGLKEPKFVSYLLQGRKVLAVFEPPNSTGHAQEVAAELNRLGLLQPPPPP